MIEKPAPTPPTEPSVWDYVVSELKIWKRSKSEGDLPEEVPPEEDPQPKPKKPTPWLTFAAAMLALIAQLSLEPSPGRAALPGILLYGISLVLLIAAVFTNEWRIPGLNKHLPSLLSTDINLEFLIVSFFLAILAFVLFGNGRFNFFNTLLWVLSIVFFFLAFWRSGESKRKNISKLIQRFNQEGWHLRLSKWTVIVLAVIAVILFFNFMRLDSVPPEMVSDNAEKLMDINDILNGHFPVYFPRNTGREVLHFYATAAYMRVFNLDVNFLNLKVVAVFANLLTLFFIYLLGKELGDRWVGLAAALFAGMAYWPLIFTRLALRIPYYPLFVAPVMYFFVRGLRKQNINDILWTGLFLGLGLHGYSPFRIVPFLLVLGVLIYGLHAKSKVRGLTAVYGLIVIAFVSLLVFLPLLRYWLANPDLFGYRAFSRLTEMEVGFPRSPILIFLENFWNASLMFFWDNGTIWVHSIPRRPALEVVSAAFYFLGIISLIVRYARQKDWRDLFLLVSIPMLLMPSILSLAYPGENPSLNRTAGAVVPVFVVVAIAFVAFIRVIKNHVSSKMGQGVVVMVVALFVLWSGANNYNLVFNQYYNIFRANSWNTSEIGRVAAFFIDTLGEPDTTYVGGYPHWADSRLVAINAGYTGMDFAIFSHQIPDLSDDPRAKMFFLNLNDAENIQALQETFPSGVLWQYESEVENKDFMIFFVPPIQGFAP